MWSSLTPWGCDLAVRWGLGTEGNHRRVMNVRLISYATGVRAQWGACCVAPRCAPVRTRLINDALFFFFFLLPSIPILSETLKDPPILDSPPAHHHPPPPSNHTHPTPQPHTPQPPPAHPGGALGTSGPSRSAVPCQKHSEPCGRKRCRSMKNVFPVRFLKQE